MLSVKTAGYRVVRGKEQASGLRRSFAKTSGTSGLPRRLALPVPR
jgi:hypothetical protein